MKNIAVCFVCMASLFLSPLNAFSVEDSANENTENALMEITGKVVSVDTDNEMIMVEYQLEGQETVTTTVFTISDEAEINENGEVIEGSELTMGDSVRVAYWLDENNIKVVSKITVEN